MYCTVSDVYRLARPSRMYTDGNGTSEKATVPSLFGVVNFVYEIANDIKMELVNAGISTSPLSQTSLRKLREMNAYGAAAKSEMERCLQNQVDASQLYSVLVGTYRNMLDEIASDPGKFGGTSTQSIPDSATNYFSSLMGVDGVSSIDPIFVRDDSY